MFGYVRTCKPELKIKEFAEYKGVYCSVCKEMGRTYGRLARFALTYDAAFLAMLAASLNESSVKFSCGRCPLNPFKKCSFCETGGSEILMASAVSIILTYYKLRDDIDDSSLTRKLLARFLLCFVHRPYKKAAKIFDEVDKIVCEQMRLQKLVEATSDPGIDASCEPFSALLSRIFQMLSSEEKQKIILREFGYSLGRWIYLIDAADDFFKDLKNHSFNPFINEFFDNRNLDRATLCAGIKPVLNQTLGKLICSYNLLTVNKFRPILDNIVYFGLSATQSKILKEEKSDDFERPI